MKLDKKANAYIEGAEASAPLCSVRTLGEHEWPAWDAFVSQSPTGTLFHTTKWLRTTATPSRIYGCYCEDNLLGGMVVEIIRERVASHSYFATLPDQPDIYAGYWFNCPYLGVVLPPPSNKYLTTLTQHRDILNSLAGHVRDQFDIINSRMGPNVMDIRPFVEAGYVIHPGYTYRIDLSDLTVAWNSMSEERRNDIRKAERDGFVIDDRGLVHDVLSLLKGTFQRQSEAVRFNELAVCRDQMLRANNQGRAFVARDRSGQAVAGIYMVWDEKCAYYLWGGYGTTAAHRGAGALAIWEAIRYAGNTLRLQQFNLLASSLFPIEQFMRDFGGYLTLAFIVRYERPSFSKDLRKIMWRLKKIIRVKRIY